MPYNIEKVKGGFKVKSPTSFKSKKPMSYRKARLQQKAIYMHTKGKE